MKKANIVLLPGDGIGPEVVAEARRRCSSTSRPASGTRSPSRRTSSAAPPSTPPAARCRRRRSTRASRATRSCSAPWAARSGTTRAPRCGRSRGSSRSVRCSVSTRTCARCACTPRSRTRSPIKAERVEGVDILFVRELTGGLYFGKPRLREKVGDRIARRRHARVHRRRGPPRRAARAAPGACGRRKLVTSVDKANVLESSRLWREVADRGRGGRAERAPRAPARRLVRDAPHHGAPVVRRRRHREHVRRHLDRRSRGARRLAGSLAERLARRRARAASTSRSTARPPTSPARASPTRSAPS